MIVIDEEHENTFKQESTPRYHARDVAVMRAKLEKSPSCWGRRRLRSKAGTTPERDHYKLLTLPSRVLERPLPEVRLIDLRHEARSSGNQLHRPIAWTSGSRVAVGRRTGDVIVESPRFFHSRSLSGLRLRCDSENCDLALTFHQAAFVCCATIADMRNLPINNVLLAVSHRSVIKDRERKKYRPRSWRNSPIRSFGAWTAIPLAPGSHQRILDAFREGGIHILVGTQMIAKGLDFPNVTLVGVINADVGLHLPDFRSGERTFQLLAQVRGEPEGAIWAEKY